MRKKSKFSTLLLFWLAAFSIGQAVAQDRESGPWWPHPIWGAEDQAGGSNWITPEKIVEALSIVESGKIYELGFPYTPGMPLGLQRTYTMTIPGLPTGGPFASGMVYNDEFVCGQIGQIGTQFDGLGHIGRQVVMADGDTTNVFYNGFTQQEIQGTYGLRKLGIEHIKPIVTRGILIDIAGLMGVDILPDRYLITLDDVQKALSTQGIDEASIEAGDALFFNTGWWRLAEDAERYLSFAWPGLGPDVVEWVIDKNISMTGFDASGDRGGDTDVHFKLIMENGIFSHEFMTFQELLEDGAYEYLFMFAPIRFEGATGSPGRPVAIR